MTEITIPANDRRIQYTATAGQTVFPYDFPIFDESNITVIQNSTTLTLTTHYTVSGVGQQSGGNITLLTGATLNDTITIVGATPYARTTDFTQAGDYLAATLNRELDLIAQQIQQINTNVGRGLVLKPEDTSTSAELPVASSRASKFLAFDANGVPIASAGTTGDSTSPVSAFMDTLLDDVDAGAALDTLGISAFAKTILDDTSASAVRATIGTEILDEDDMASNSATKLATQQSIKAYVDNSVVVVAAASQAQMEAASSTSVYASPGTMKYSPGVAKAWVNFAGATGTINAGYNVTSVTKNATGDYTINFTTAMGSVNYCVVGMGVATSGSNSTTRGQVVVKDGSSLTTTACTIITGDTDSNNKVDLTAVFVVFFGDFA